MPASRSDRASAIPPIPPPTMATLMVRNPLVPSGERPERECSVAPDETEVVAVVSDQRCTDPARAERDQNVVQQRGQFTPPAPVTLPDCGDDLGRAHPVVESRAHDAPGPLHRQQ